jgi:hypothetical protein
VPVYDRNFGPGLEARGIFPGTGVGGIHFGYLLVEHQSIFGKIKTLANI